MLIDLLPRRLRSTAAIASARRAGARVHSAEVATRARSVQRDLRRLPADIATDELVVARARRHAYLGRVVEPVSTQRSRDENLRLAIERIESAGIAYFLMSARAGNRAVVGVAAADRGATIAALDRQVDDRVCYLARIARGRMAHQVRAGRGAGRRLASASALRFFDVTASTDGVLLTGPDEGCEIEFWDLRDGVLAAPRPNPYAVELRTDDRVQTEVVAGGRAYTTYRAFTVDHAFDVTFPIDAVYTWVDGDDPAWRSRKEQAMRADGQEVVNELAANPSRYASRDELRYSLRSLDRYAEWIRTVYLVTDDQVPEWLDTTNPRLRIVSHRELFGDTGLLPTFNSHAIETKLHRIPDLAEHYLYLNDDVFFGRGVAPEMFFRGNGTHLFFPSTALFGSGPASAADAPVDAAGKNNRDLLIGRYGRTVTSKFKHAPHPMRGSVIAEVEAQFAEAVERTSRSQFRHAEDIAIMSLAHYVAWFTGSASPGVIDYRYLDIGTPGVRDGLDRLLAARDVDAFCLNDTDGGGVDHADTMRTLHTFLDAYFPGRSTFERLPASGEATAR